MNAITATLKGALKVANDLEKHRKNVDKAMSLAISTEGHDLMKKLRSELTAGSPGGKRFSTLSHISLMTGRRRRTTRTALKNLPYGIRYKAYQQNKFKHEQFKFGFIGGPSSVHGFFRSIAERHHSGFIRTITEKQRRFFTHEGMRKLGWKGKGQGYKKSYQKNLEAMEASGERPFFLRKSTRVFKTPARPIVEPFWKANKDQALKNILTKFRHKLAGNRI